MSIYTEEAKALGELLEKKDAAYGNAFDLAGDFLALLWPKGVPPEKYGDALALVRIFDKMKRIATDDSAFGEEPWKDIAGYGLLGVIKRKKAQKSKEPDDPLEWARCDGCGLPNSTRLKGGRHSNDCPACFECGTVGGHAPICSLSRPKPAPSSPPAAPVIPEKPKTPGVKVVPFQKVITGSGMTLVQPDGEKVEAERLLAAVAAPSVPVQDKIKEMLEQDGARWSEPAPKPTDAPEGLAPSHNEACRCEKDPTRLYGPYCLLLPGHLGDHYWFDKLRPETLPVRWSDDRHRS